MEILLNTIMLEPKRWQSPKVVTFSLIEVLPDIKRAGFDKLEIWGYHLWNLNPDQLSCLASEIQTRGMSVPSVGSYLTPQEDNKKENILTTAKKYFSICKKLKSGKLRIFYGDRDFERSTNQYIQFIDEVFVEMFGMGQDNDIQVIPEMHKGTVIGSIEGLRRALTKWGESFDFGVVYQPFEFKTKPALEALNLVLGHIKSVHLQNRENTHFVGLAEGDVDYRKILRKLAISSYKGPFVLEFTKGIVPSSSGRFNYKDILNSATKDRIWLESTWSEVCHE